ncbi:MAG TPA: ABC transporter permease [Anaerolineales bacterium]|nr:ABC transporter permease [Anaerolineales bacterium]
MSRSSRKTRHNPLPFIWKQIKIQIGTRALSVFSFGLLVFQPAVFSAVGYMLARMAGKPVPDLVHVIIGGGIMGMWSSLVFTSFFDISNDRREGTLELIVGSPTSITTVLAVRTLANVLTGMVSMLLSFFVALFFFRLSIPLHNLPYIAISLLILFFGFWCMGVFLAHFRVVSRVTGMFINYLELPVAILAAFMFPISYLPHWVMWLSNSIPLRWGVSGLNASFGVQPTLANIWLDWAISTGVSLIYLLVTYLLSEKVHRMIRLTGELSSV